MRSVPANSAAAIECTGASPQRCFIWSIFSSYLRGGKERDDVYLIVKATATIEVLKERRVGLAAPKVHIGNLKVAPNCLFI